MVTYYSRSLKDRDGVMPSKLRIKNMNPDLNKTKSKFPKSVD